MRIWVNLPGNNRNQPQLQLIKDSWRQDILTKQPEPTRCEAGGWRQAGAARRNRVLCLVESLCQAIVVMLVSLLWRDSHSTLLPIPLRISIRERGGAPSFLTVLAEQRHQIDGIVSEDHLHSTWCGVNPRCCLRTSNTIDWLRLW